MSKLLKKDLLREDNSFHISQQKASIDSLIATYATTQHNRDIKTSISPYPKQGVTAGAGNCYFNQGLIWYGTTGKTNYCRSQFVLPADYVDGENFTIDWSWFISGGGGGADMIDYKFLIFRSVDSDVQVLEQTIDLTHVGANGDKDNFETETITGTNFSASDKITILLYMEDHDNARESYLNNIQLIVPVNTRD